MGQKYKFASICILTFLFLIPCLLQGQSSPDGNYVIGDRKCTIKFENDEFRVYWEDTEGSSKLIYKEDILTGEHIWVEKKRGKSLGNFIMQSDYKSGVYVHFADNEKFNIVRLE